MLKLQYLRVPTLLMKFASKEATLEAARFKLCLARGHVYATPFRLLEIDQFCILGIRLEIAYKYGVFKSK